MSVDAELEQRLAATLGVDDDRVEALEEAPPEITLPGSAPRQEVVRREHRRGAKPQSDVGLRQRQPLHVHDVRPRTAERRHDAEVLDRFQRQPNPGALEQPRREPVVALIARVPVGRRQVAEAEPRRRDGHRRTLPGERARELVVVPRRERGWIGEKHAHAQ